MITKLRQLLCRHAHRLKDRDDHGALVLVCERCGDVCTPDIRSPERAAKLKAQRTQQRDLFGG